MMLLVDTNERGPIIPLLDKYKIQYRREDIDVDYKDENGAFVIERKTTADFKNSVLNGHLKKQCEYMARTYPRVPKYILLEGTLEDAVFLARNGKEMLISFFYRAPHVYNIQIVETVDVIGTIKALLAIIKYAPGAERLLEEGAIEMPPKTSDPRIRTLMTFPSVGKKTAKLLLEHYGSLMDIFTSDDMDKIRGIGKGTKEAIKNYLEAGRKTREKNA